MKMGQLIKTMMFYGKETSDEQEKILIVSKDDEGNKKHTFIDKPVIGYHITKPEYRNHGMELFIPEEHTDLFYSENRNLIGSIVKNLNDANVTQEYQRIM